MGRKRDEAVERETERERGSPSERRLSQESLEDYQADEFVSDLDMALALEILSRIRRAAAQEQITFVMSMHRQGLVREFAENVVTLREGHIAPGFIPAVSQGPAVVEMLQ